MAEVSERVFVPDCENWLCNFVFTVVTTDSCRIVGLLKPLGFDSANATNATVDAPKA
jgi:hypothetical protein